MKGLSLTGREIFVIILSKKIIQRIFDALHQSKKKLARVMKGLSLTRREIYYSMFLF